MNKNHLSGSCDPRRLSYILIHAQSMICEGYEYVGAYMIVFGKDIFQNMKFRKTDFG